MAGSDEKAKQPKTGQRPVQCESMTRTHTNRCPAKFGNGIVGWKPKFGFINRRRYKLGPSSLELPDRWLRVTKRKKGYRLIDDGKGQKRTMLYISEISLSSAPAAERVRARVQCSSTGVVDVPAEVAVIERVVPASAVLDRKAGTSLLHFQVKW